jgi:hypothetical protein
VCNKWTLTSVTCTKWLLKLRLSSVVGLPFSIRSCEFWGSKMYLPLFYILSLLELTFMGNICAELLFLWKFVSRDRLLSYKVPSQIYSKGFGITILYIFKTYRILCQVFCWAKRIPLSLSFSVEYKYILKHFNKNCCCCSALLFVWVADLTSAGSTLLMRNA